VSSRNGLSAAVTLLVIAGLGALAAFMTLPPAAAGRDAPEAEFSAQRAITRLGPIVGDPHPAGSVANEKVRDYLVDQLRGLGLRPSTDTRVAGRAHADQLHVVGTVTNIRARLPGSAPSGRIVLVAHYDSVASGPGAADDGSNVAAILEIVRALKAAPPLRNDVEILFTDGEEVGDLGAQAYVDSGGAADPRRTAVVNMEARGTSGPAIMFQTVGANAGLMRAAGASGALATSVSDDIYELLPNYTDLTVFGEAGLRGLNFAFVGGSANYHTQHDDLAHLDASSVQDMGASVLAAVRELGGSDLGALPDGDDSYFTVLGLFVHYPAWLVWPLALLAALAVVAAIWSHRRRGARPGRIGDVAASFLGPVIAAAAIGIALWLFLLSVRPLYALLYIGDTYRSQYYATGFTLLALVALTIWYRWARRRATVAEVALASLSWLATLALVTAAVAPGGAYLFTWPAVIGASAMAAAQRWAGEGSPWHAIAAGAAAAPAMLLVVPIVLLLFPLLGISLAAAPLVAAVLFGATALSLLPFTPRVFTVMQSFVLVAAVTLVGVGLGVDGFDIGRPRPVSLGYAVDGDTGRAYWVTTGEPDEPMVAPLLAQRVTLPTGSFPNLPPRPVLATVARPTRSVVVPTLQQLGDRRRSDGARDTSVRVQAGPGASYVYVYGDAIEGATVGGIALPGGTNVGGRWGAGYAAPPADGIEMTFTTHGPLTVRVIALYGTLPADAGAPGLPPDASWVTMSALAGQTSATREFTV